MRSDAGRPSCARILRTRTISLTISYAAHGFVRSQPSSAPRTNSLAAHEVADNLIRGIPIHAQRDNLRAVRQVTLDPGRIANRAPVRTPRTNRLTISPAACQSVRSDAGRPCCARILRTRTISLTISYAAHGFVRSKPSSALRTYSLAAHEFTDNLIRGIPIHAQHDNPRAVQQIARDLAVWRTAHQFARRARIG
ncbi:hypothetical protein [Nocardia sp. NPDC060255]|uniref:hypothetical protein n=1 Tax=Nocardia sp. NPDC060255 TaxID=3347085 RepID=UPI0036476397